MNMFFRRGSSRASPTPAISASATRVRVRPTPTGWGLFLLSCALALMAINQGNNLLYAMAFMVVSVLLVSGVQGWRNLAGLQASLGPASAVFAGHQAALQARFDGTVPRYGLRTSLETCMPGSAPTWQPVQEANIDVSPGGSSAIRLAWNTTQRGWQQASRLRVVSDYPLGITRACMDLPVRAELLAWPAPASVVPPAIARGDAQQAHEADDFAGLSAWRMGDSPRRIAWKSLARGGPTMVKRFDGERGLSAVLVDWAELQGATEARLSMLARRLLDIHADGQGWLLRLPGQVDLAGHSQADLHHALERLALFPAEA